MGFRMIPPKRVRKVKTKNGQEVLRRLEEYLESAAVTGEPIEILCGFWKDQQDAITYQELRQAVKEGSVSQELLRLWQQDYSILVEGTLSKLWTDAITAGPAGQPILDGIAFELNMQTSGILNWIRERGAEFVTASTKDQKDAIAALLTKKMRDGHTVDELSRLIRPCIGLTEGDAKAAVKFYDSIVATLKKDHPRMKPESIRRKALDATQKYAERKHRARAMTIAQTESAFAYNRGADEGIRQAQEQNLLGKCKKRWNTSGDDQVCKLCASLDGVEIDMDSDFEIGGKLLFNGQHLLPPAHPRCACAVEYIEVSPPAFLGAGGADDFQTGENAGTNMQKLGEIDPEKTEEALEYYGDLFREDMVENVVVIDKAGNLYHAAGSSTSVSISGIDMAGASITHNHPLTNGIVSFGEEDFQFMKENPNIAKLQAVNKYYTYSAVPLDKIKEISYNEIYREALIHGMEAVGEDLQHLAMEALAEKGGVIYARKAVK
ncbi:hypothetical protein D7X98_04165 [bacterium 1XD8-76]|nr:hypothetical protein D7X98_04165 [bacterium 1XD8-76]